MLGSNREPRLSQAHIHKGTITTILFHFQCSIQHITWDIQHYYKRHFVLDDFVQV